MKKVRKIIKIGESRGITLPPGWVEGEYVAMEKRGDAIIVKPLKEVG